MKITQTAQLALSEKGTPATALKAMLAQVPDNATVSIEVDHIPADRPWESAHTNVAVFAEWFVEVPG